MTQEKATTRQIDQSDDIISLSEIVGIIMNGKWWVIGSTLVFAACALAYLWLATPTYRADALIQVETRRSPLSTLVDIEGALGGESASVTEVEVIRSRFVLGQVVRSENLHIIAEPDYFPVIGRAVARRFRSDIENGEYYNVPLPGMGSYAWGGESIQVESFDVPMAMRGQNYTLIADSHGQYLCTRQKK